MSDPVNTSETSRRSMAFFASRARTRMRLVGGDADALAYEISGGAHRIAFPGVEGEGVLLGADGEAFDRHVLGNRDHQRWRGRKLPHLVPADSDQGQAVHIGAALNDVQFKPFLLVEAHPLGADFAGLVAGVEPAALKIDPGQPLRLGSHREERAGRRAGGQCQRTGGERSEKGSYRVSG
jgi:hypothetical protein